VIRRLVPACAALLIVCAALPAAAAAQGTGSIAGQARRPDGTPLPGVMVVIRETGAVAWTASDGEYRIRRVPAGAHTLVLTLGQYTEEAPVTVTAGAEARVVLALDWPLSYVEAMTVVAAGRQVERVADAPAAVTVIDAAALAAQAGHAQLPLLLASAPGVQVAQSGLFDFNVNARGFNDMVNRRVRIEVDGRDTSQPHVTGNTDWASLGQALDEFEQVELVRGPGGALYGIGALNGVLSLRSKSPADAPGGRARITLGEPGTVRADARHAAVLGAWAYRLSGGYQQSGDFAVSRDRGAEYAPDRIAPEAVPIDTGRTRLAYGSARLDRRLRPGDTLVLEGGTSYKHGQITLTNLGRYQARDARFPWARAEYRSQGWQALAAVTGANIDRQLSLASGEDTFQSGSHIQLEAQANRAYLQGRTRLVGGASYGRQRADSADQAGRQTIFDQPEQSHNGALFGQAEHEVTPRLLVRAAARVDATSLTRTTLSPRAAVVYEMATGHRVRAAYSRAYKAPTLAETRLRAAVAAPVDLSAVEAALAPRLGGITLGFGRIPVLAVGNEHLEVEEVRGLEFGYSGVAGRHTLVQAVYYVNDHASFTSGLLPQVGTSLGRLNPSFGPYTPPAAASPALAADIQAALGSALTPHLLAALTNLADGRPAFAVLSLANFGAARTRGLELSAITFAAPALRVEASYAWFGFSLDASAPETPLVPNTPAHQGSASISYTSPRIDAGARVRLVSAFDWVSGVYAGRVPAYGLADARASVPLVGGMRLGVDVTNLLDHAHYQMFGGDLLRRRALAYLTVSRRPHISRRE
jgi:outer membrane receptor protein involved in Fe transport